MEIKDSVGIGPRGIDRRTPTSSTSTPARTSRPDPGTGTDRVEISGRSKEMAKAAEAAHSATDLRQEKIEAIRQKIASNTYEVPSEKVAHKMILEFLEELV